jgi:hypothetical protein
MRFSHSASHFVKNHYYTVTGTLEEFLPPSVGIPVNAAYIAYATGKEDPGNRPPRLAGTVSAASVAWGAWYVQRRALLFAFTSLTPEGWALKGVLGLLGLAESGRIHALEKAAYRGFNKFRHFERRGMQLEMGGDYRDTDSNQAMRLAAASEMTGALGNSRRFMGQEARFLHT